MCLVVPKAVRNSKYYDYYQTTLPNVLKLYRSQYVAR